MPATRTTPPLPALTAITAAVLTALALTGCAQHTDAAAPAPRPGPAVASTRLDPGARDLAAHKAHASLVTMKRHARATAKRKAAARRAREAARIAAQQQAQQRNAGDAGGHHTQTFAERCPNGAATGPQCSTPSTRRWARDQANWAQREYELRKRYFEAHPPHPATSCPPGQVPAGVTGACAPTD